MVLQTPPDESCLSKIFSVWGLEKLKALITFRFWLISLNHIKNDAHMNVP